MTQMCAIASRWCSYQTNVKFGQRVYPAADLRADLYWAGSLWYREHEVFYEWIANDWHAGWCQY